MQTNEEVVYLYLDDIIPNRFQPREVFDEKPLKELAVSIKEHGVIQPIIVRKANDKYEIIAGERRYKASALAGLTKIPAIIRDLDDKESSKVALLENLQRKNLNAIEEAKTYQKIIEIDEMTQEELAKTMGKSQSAVANKLRLLSLPDEIQEALMKDQISERHARALLNIDDTNEQKEMLNKIINEKMTVRQLESEIKKMNGKEEVNFMENMNNDGVVTNLPNAEEISNTTSFIPENPILPNFSGENSEINTPILSNIESITSSNNNENESNTEETPKFINFGEINDDDTDNDSTDNGPEIDFNTPASNSSIDINELKSNTSDIEIPTAKNGNADLDSLLQLGAAPVNNNQVTESNESNSNFKFFSPAAEALQDSEKQENNSSEDYFKAPDLISVDLPSEVQTSNINSVNLNNVDGSIPITSSTSNHNSNLNDAIEIVRKSVKSIESLGLKVDIDEMSLQNSYQVMIKIEK